jgi:hypothetical protein
MREQRLSKLPYDIVTIDSWAIFQKTLAESKYRTWAFRGQSKEEWPLFSSISRYLKDFKVHPDAWLNQESRIVRVFKRKAHLFLDHVPQMDDDFQWLALMQHHGAPTRLLDFTWSPFVAVFFALEKAITSAAIWAVNPEKIYSARIRSGKKGEYYEPYKYNLRTGGNYEKYYLNKHFSFVLYGEPFVMNQRIVAQSGTFVYSSDLNLSIDQILSIYPNPKDLLVKFVINTDKIRDEAMYELFNMNITNATLFPGLDGMTRSLAYELEFHWAYNPKTMNPYLD